MNLDAKVIRETLAGYERANEVTERERRERLINMTAEESLAIYEDLDSTFTTMRAPDPDGTRLGRWRLETTLAVRRALDLLAAASRTP